MGRQRRGYSVPPTCSPHLWPVELQVLSRGRNGLQSVWAQGFGGVVQAGVARQPPQASG